MEFKRIFDFLHAQLAEQPLTDCLACKRDGKWVKYSTQEVVDIVDSISRGLLSSGIEKGDRIAVVSDSCPEWNFVDWAAQQIGAVSVPIYPSLASDNYKYIIEHSESKIVFAQTQEYYDKANSKRAEIDGLREIYTFNKLAGAKHYEELIEAGESSINLQPHRDAVQPDDLATFVYTSGTTGLPKGVMLTHTNIVSNVIDTSNCGLLPSDEEIRSYDNPRALSFLPLSHIFERVVVNAYVYKKIPIYYAQSVETVGDDMREVQPVVFSAVPRLIEKVYEKIIAKGNALSGFKHKLFFWALDLVKDYQPYHNYGAVYNLKLGIARKLIFSKWKEAMGGKVEMIVSGSAKLLPKYMHIFWGAGIPIFEAYGMTETSPGITANRNKKNGIRIGSVGQPITNIQVKIEPEPGYPAGEGEVCAKGPNVMQGYYKNADATNAVLKDGWMHTGDIGKIDEDGFLFITDRKKEMFKTSQGKYIAPQHIEGKLKESNYIEQIMVVGENKKFCGALIVPSFENLNAWAKDKGLNFKDDAELANSPEAKQLLEKEINRLNEPLDRHEQIKQFRLLDKEWTIDGGELTPTLKVKRRVINDKYKQQIESIYTEAAKTAA